MIRGTFADTLSSPYHQAWLAYCANDRMPTPMSDGNPIYIRGMFAGGGGRWDDGSSCPRRSRDPACPSRRCCNSACSVRGAATFF